MASHVAVPPPLPHPETPKLADGIVEELWFGDDDPGQSHYQASKSLAAEAARLRGLKPFPVVAQRVMALVSDPAVRLDEVRRALETDLAEVWPTAAAARGELLTVFG